MTTLQKAADALETRSLARFRRQGERNRLSRDIQSLVRAVPEGTAEVPWNTYFDELIYRLPRRGAR